MDAGSEATVRAAMAGDARAQRALFDQHRRVLMSYCLVAARGDRDRAMDLLQDTFTRAFRALPELQDPARFRGWLFTIAGNVCRTRLGQEGRRREVLELVALEQELSPDPEQPEDRERRVALVQSFLSQLDDAPLRQIVILKYGEPEHSTREIAAKLAIPHGTVTVKLMRFRAKVRAQLLAMLAASGLEPTA